ncbi:MAG: hypothetical protein EB003_13395 [Flavobacteriia bacterium]|jgi:hypothetical protein|nr:hypothetical protein [Flavobacteriia bacterium]
MFIFGLSEICNIAGLPTSSGLKFASVLTIAKAVPCLFAAFQSKLHPFVSFASGCGKVLPCGLPFNETSFVSD